MKEKRPLMQLRRVKKYFHIRRRLRLRALSDINFVLYEGEKFGVVGESGCGKSTLGRVMLQLYPLSGGDCLYYGRSLVELCPGYLKREIKNLLRIQGNAKCYNDQLLAAVKGPPEIYERARKLNHRYLREGSKTVGSLILCENLPEIQRLFLQAYQAVRRAHKFLSTAARLEARAEGGEGEPGRAGTLRVSARRYVEEAAALREKAFSFRGKNIKATLSPRALDPDYQAKLDANYETGISLSKLTGREMRSLRSEMQMVFQDPSASLDPRQAVGKAVEEPFKIHGRLSPGERKEKVTALLEQVGLQEEHYYYFPNALSGGQKQRVCIARAIATNTRLVVLDESLSALDVSVQAQILQLLKELSGSGRTYLFITHDLGVAKYFCDRIMVMYLGCECELADARAIFEKPLHPYTRSLLAAVPRPVNERFGRLPLTKVLAPAIAYAREGYPLAPNLASAFARSAERFKAQGSDPAFAEWWKTFMPGGETPRPGDILVLKNHGDTLEAIANTRAEAFYRGELAERILADSREFGGYFSREDFSSYRPEWVEPVSVNYRGYDVWELPPNGQGISALMALNILKEFSFTQRDRADTFHKQWEAMKLAFSDALAHITDPHFMKADYREWLSPEYGVRRAREIGDTAGLPQAEHPPQSGTVYLCTADREGGMVSYIQSNYMGFGSGVVVRDTGIALQNRGSDFSLDPGAPNCLAPGKKSYHTIIPGFLTKDGQALGPFGVMGGYMQPQGHVQVVTNLLDFGLNPQQALDAPRWLWTRGRSFSVEDRFSAEIARTLASMGHEVNISLANTVFGRGQIILRLENGVLVGATESRTDSNIACW